MKLHALGGWQGNLDFGEIRRRDRSLRRQLLALAGWTSQGEGVFIARARHLDALATRRRKLEMARSAGRQLEFFAEELRLAQDAVSEITGEFGADDLLGVIFSQFCIGK
jgi:tRNA modification GTPase